MSRRSLCAGILFIALFCVVQSVSAACIVQVDGANIRMGQYYWAALTDSSDAIIVDWSLYTSCPQESILPPPEPSGIVGIAFSRVLSYTLDVYYANGRVYERMLQCGDAGTWYLIHQIPSTCTPSATSVEQPRQPAIQRTLRSVPNPTSHRASIDFDVPKRGMVRVEIFDARGALVRMIADSIQQPGSQRWEWDGSTNAGTSAPAGTYYWRVTSNGAELTTRSVIVR